jgi:hypothetical protein
MVKKDEIPAPEAAPVETRAVPTPAAPTPPAIDAQAVTKAERERQAEIRKLVRASGLDGQEELLERFGASTQTLDEIRKEIMDKRAEESLKHEPSPSRVRVGDDASDKRRTGMEAAILVRSGAIHILQRAAKAQPSNPLFQKLPTDPGEFRGMRMLRMFEQDQESRGVKVRGVDEMELAGRAMTEIGRAWERGLGDLIKRGIDGGQVGADFPVALVNAMHKTALGKYALAPATWRRFCGVGTVNDFRAHPQFRASGIAALSLVQPNGEFRNRDIADAYREDLTAQTYGNIVALTRQVLINDDMGFFSDIVGDLGNAAGETIEALVYALLTTAAGLGPNMLDGVALFNAAHNNLGAAGAIGVAKFDADRVIMGAQVDLAGRILDLMPSVLVVPNGSKGQATVINESEFDIDAVGAGTPPANRPNRVRGLFTDIVGSARLAGTRYYIFADPQLYPTIKVGFLNGQQEPFLEMQPGWRVDGTEWKVRLDVAVGAVDFRTALTAAGA